MLSGQVVPQKTGWPIPFERSSTDKRTIDAEKQSHGDGQEKY